MSSNTNVGLQRRNRLYEAMLDVFLRREDLARFMSLRFGFNVATEIGDASIPDAVLRIIEIFEPANRLETDFRDLLNGLAEEFSANQTFKALQRELDGVNRAPDVQPRTIKKGFADSQSQDSGQRGPIQVAADTQAKSRSTHAGAKSYAQIGDKQDRRPSGRLVDQDRVVAEMASAVSTLERLREQLENALKRFVESLAVDRVVDVDLTGSARDALDSISTSARDILFIGDPAEAQGELSQLLINVQAGIELGERDGDYESVRGLAKHASDSCKRVGDISDGAERLLLLSIVPFWRMREAYAEHQPNIDRQRASRTTNRSIAHDARH